jgi:hypothetical protein
MENKEKKKFSFFESILFVLAGAILYHLVLNLFFK